MQTYNIISVSVGKWTKQTLLDYCEKELTNRKSHVVSTLEAKTPHSALKKMYKDEFGFQSNGSIYVLYNKNNEQLGVYTVEFKYDRFNIKEFITLPENTEINWFWFDS